MIKCIIFDLDGVLVDTKIVHFEALNLALKKYENFEISFDDHSNTYDGLPTNEKIKILLEKRKIKAKNVEKIKLLKKKINK